MREPGYYVIDVAGELQIGEYQTDYGEEWWDTCGSDWGRKNSEVVVKSGKLDLQTLIVNNQP